MFQVKGLLDKHLAVLIRNWYFNIHGEELSEADAKKIAPKLFGHPIAARLVAGLLGNVKADFLELYPQELISLRRDLARTLLQDVNLDPPSERLMETLALAGIGLPAAVLAASVATEEQFQSAVSQCASAGLITADLNIESHPLFQDFFWHRLHRGDYKTLASNLADAITRHLGNISHSSHEYIALTPVVFRALALSGRMRDAAELRSDLRGELESAAITLYNRRDYALADRYIDQLLDFDPSNWRMRLYRARIRTHQENWSQAEEILDLMLAERPNDAGVLHAFGRLFLKRGSLDEALKTFMRVIAKREHVASLTGAAESLHRMGRNEEALAFLSRAKERESENFFVLDLESRILEDEGELDLAYTAALLASNRDPLHAQLHARLGVISSKRGRPDLAVQHLQRAVQLDPGLFHATHSLASALLDIGQSGEAEAVLRTLTSLAKNPTNSSLVEHLRARLFMAKGDLESAVRTLRRELAGSRNVVPNLGLLVEVQCQLFDREDVELTAIAETHLASAEEALHQLLKMDPNNEFADRLKERVRSRTKA
jgi:tetratricopeptide (TPR) repeat protein